MATIITQPTVVAATPARSGVRESWRVLRRNPMGMVGMVMLVLVVFAAVFAAEVAAGHAAPPSIWAIFALPLFVVNAIVALGFGLLLSGLTTRYRDMVQVLGFGIQLWMYATPVIYPLSQLPERWRILAALNPISTTVELFRLLVFSTGSVSLTQVCISAIVAATVLLAGLVVFARGSLRAADTV